MYPRCSGLFFSLLSNIIPVLDKKDLIEASGELKAQKLTVLTWDEKREIEKDGLTVLFKLLHEWLLGVNENS